MADIEYNSLTKWKQDFLKTNVQPKALDSGGDFLSSETMVLIAGPPRLDASDSDLTTTVPIGLVQNVQVNQNKQIQQVYEIGSRIPYMIPGRTVVSVGMSRVLFDGPSLMKALALQKVADGDVSFDEALATKYNVTDRNDLAHPGLPLDVAATDASESGEFFINLASQFFNLPMGLGIVLYDGEKEAYGGFYLNECYIQNHSFAAAAAQTVLVENISIRVTDLSPLLKDQIS